MNPDPHPISRIAASIGNASFCGQSVQSQVARLANFTNAFANAETIAAFSIRRATAADVPGILDLQARNLPERGGLLSVGFPQAWFEAAIAAMPLIVAERGGQVLGYLVSAPFSALAQVPSVQAMLRA